MFQNGYVEEEAVVAITAVDLERMVFEGRSSLTRPTLITMSMMPGGDWLIPQVGEQWLIKRSGRAWFLSAKMDFQDERRLMDQSQGMSVYGRRGPTFLVGSEVSVESPLFVEGDRVRGPKKFQHEAGGMSTPVPQGQTVEVALPLSVPDSVGYASFEGEVTFASLPAQGAVSISAEGRTETRVLPASTNPITARITFVDEMEEAPSLLVSHSLSSSLTIKSAKVRLVLL